MENFNIFNPVKVHFGKDVIKNLPSSLGSEKRNILLVFGKNSIKKSGLYQKVMDQLSSYNVIEYSGIKSNPIIEDVNAAAAIARQNNVDAIIAVGGGSVIDTSKVISVAQHYDGDAWDIMKNQYKPQKASPVYAVLTLAATGTEMNAFAVVQNHETQEKIGWGCPLTYPKESFLDPQLTTTVPANYTAFGMVDIIAHSLESYFGKGESPLSDAFVIANIKEVASIAKSLMNDLTNYDLRARILLSGTVALNGTMTYGKAYGDWGVHALGHGLSLLYDMPHGASLSIAYPAWMKHHKDKLQDKILMLGKGVFDVNTVDETIESFEHLFQEIGSPIRISAYGIEESEKGNILAYYKEKQVNGSTHLLQDADREHLLELMW